ncbi:Putative RhtB family transporter [Erwinia amylovora Ea644]|nr:Putative RhtB family transporter [Erwinia amylovora Ea644]
MQDMPVTFDQTATGSGLIFVVGAGDFSAPHLNSAIWISI